MVQSQISISTGTALSIFFTIFFGSLTILNIFLGIKSLMKPEKVILTIAGLLFVLFMVYCFLLFWTTVKVYDDKTMEVTTKTIFGSKTYRYKDITKIKLYHVPKGGYAIRVYQAGVEKPRFNGSFGYKNAQQLVAFFQKTSLPFETKLFQKK